MDDPQDQLAALRRQREKRALIVERAIASMSPTPYTNTMKKDLQGQLSFEDALFSPPTEDPVPTETEPPTVYRTAKLPLKLSRRQQAQVLWLMTAQRRLYNAAIAYSRCPAGVPVLCWRL